MTAVELPETNGETAAKVFAELSTLLFSFEDGTLKGDVESIHDMRVTSRRFRVALANFSACVEPGLRRRVKDNINQLADVLGRVRDVDVMLESLPGIEAEEPVSRKPVIDDLRARLIRRRRYHYLRLGRYFKSQQYVALKETLAELTNGKALQSKEAVTG